MTETEKMVSNFTTGLGGSRNRKIFNILEENNLHALGKSNTGTLLYQYSDGNGTFHDIFAFRQNPPVFSFPQSYWLKRSVELNEHLGNFKNSEKPELKGPVSTSQYSAGQIEITRNTYERLIDICNLVCKKLT